MNCDHRDFIATARQILSGGNAVRFTACGASMYPFIRDSDIVIVRPVKFHALRCADVVLYESGEGRAIVHRVRKRIQRNGGWIFEIRGDATRTSDGYVEGGRVLGKVEAIEKDGRMTYVGRGLGRSANIAYTACLPLSKWIYLVAAAPFRLRKKLRLRSIAGKKTRRVINTLVRRHLSRGEDPGIDPAFLTGLDWDEVFRMAERERVSPCIYLALKDSKESVPSDAIAPFERAYRRTAVRNIVLAGETKKILRAFADRGIRSILLKGLFLAETIYQNIALRPMADIDILVEKERLPLVHATLVSLGYSAPHYYEDMAMCRGPVSVNSLMYQGGGGTGQPGMHIHWHLVNSTWPVDDLVERFDMKRVWAKARPITIDGALTLTLSPEHMVIYLAHHAFHHSFDTLSTVLDVAKVTRHYHEELDRESVRKEAELLGLSSVVSQALAHVSKTILDEDADYIGLRQRYLSSYAAYLATCKGLRKKCVFIFKTLIPPRLVLAHNLNIRLSEVRKRDYARRITQTIQNYLFRHTNTAVLPISPSGISQS